MTLHGYESSNTGPKTDKLQETYNVINPKINFAEKDCYNNLITLANKHKPQLIVGSSMGGYLGYSLSNETNIPCLLFNPALIETFSGNIKPDVQIPSNTCSRKFIVIGKHDDVVNPVLLKKWLNENANNAVVFDENIGHRIPIDVYIDKVKYVMGLLTF